MKRASEALHEIAVVERSQFSLIKYDLITLVGTRSENVAEMIFSISQHTALKWAFDFAQVGQAVDVTRTASVAALGGFVSCDAGAVSTSRSRASERRRARGPAGLGRVATSRRQRWARFGSGLSGYTCPRF